MENYSPKSLSNLPKFNLMIITLATPIFPPNIGGPSKYAENLYFGLKKEGFEVQVLTLSDFFNYPKIIRNFIYFFHLFKKSKNSQIIYAFNPISCGLPSFLISQFSGKKFILRLGGDYLWERAFEEGRTKKTLKEYYREPKNLKERFLMKIIKIILERADRIIFTSNFLKNIYVEHFKIPENKLTIIENPFPKIENLDVKSETIFYQLLYAGRLLKFKNLDILIQIFQKISERNDKNLILKIIGEGPEKENLKLKIKNLKLENKVFIEPPLPHQELLKEIQKSYFCILPALTDITPNFALECLKLKKPILLTKETEYYEIFKENLIFIDPQNEKDIEEKIIYLLNEKNYRDYIERISQIPNNYSWNDVITKHIKLFQELI